jgi:hypothetical protein
MLSLVAPLLIAVGVFGTLLAAFFVGARFVSPAPDVKDDLGVIQGATLGIVGLVVGFSLSGATARFVDRQDLIVDEANAIGTAWLRADMLSDTARDNLKATLRRYAERRLNVAQGSGGSDELPLQAELSRLQREAWSIAAIDLRDRPQPSVLVLPALNDVFDLLSRRNAAADRHMPALTATLLFVSALLSAALMGYGHKTKPRSVRVAGISVVILIGGLIWATIDLDFPQRGLARISPQPLIDLLNTMPP